MTRPAAKTAELRLERTGEMTVAVKPPTCDEPEGLLSWWAYEGRNHYHRLRPGDQRLRVSYQVFSDPLQLADLCERSLRNKSGEAIRGASVARGGKLADLGLTDRLVRDLVRIAANSKNGRAFEGPLNARVKLLEQPTPVAARCSVCKRPPSEHVREEIQRLGDWGDAGPTGHRQWDPQKPRIDLRWWCPNQEEVQA